MKKLNQEVTLIFSIHLFLDCFLFTETPNFSKRGSVANGYTLVDTDVLPIKNGTGGTMPSYEVRNSLSTTTGVGEMYGNDDNDDDNDDDDDDQDDTVDFTPPKYLPEMPVVSPVQSPSVPMSMQKVFSFKIFSLKYFSFLF